MLKKLFGVLLLATLVLGVAAPMALAAPAAAPTAQDLLTRLNGEEQSRTNARALILEAQRLQQAADTAKGVYDAAQKTASDALVAAQTADATARGSLPSFVTVVAQPTLSATWAPIAQLLPGNALVQAAWNAAKTAESLQTVATQKATEWGTATTAATTALDKAIAAMPVPPTDPAIARLEGELKEAKTAQVKAEGEVVQLRKELTTEKARADRFETRVGELEKKLAGVPAPVTPPPPVAAPAAAAPWWDATAEVAQLRKERDAAQAALVAAPTQGQLDMAKADLAKVTTERDAARVEAKANAEAKAKAEVALTAAQTEVAELRKQLEAAKAPQTQQQTAAPTAAPATSAPAPATVAPSATATPTEPMATKASVDALEKRVGKLDDRLVKAEDAIKGIDGLMQAVKDLTAATKAQTAEIVGLRGEIATSQTTVAAQATTIITLRADLEAFQAQLFWTWIALAGLLLLGLLIAIVVGVRRWLVVLRTTRRAAGTSGTSGTAVAPVASGAPATTP